MHDGRTSILFKGSTGLHRCTTGHETPLHRFSKNIVYNRLPVVYSRPYARGIYSLYGELPVEEYHNLM
jgi:hypothetical protein